MLLFLNLEHEFGGELIMQEEKLFYKGSFAQIGFLVIHLPTYSLLYFLIFQHVCSIQSIIHMMILKIKWLQI